MAEENLGSRGLYSIDKRNSPLFFGTSSYMGRFKQRSLSKYPSVDIDGFYNLVKLALDDYYASFSVIESDQFVFVPEFPQDLREEHLGKTFNFLTYKLLKRNPPLSKSSGKPRVAPYSFDEGPDTDYSGYIVQRDITLRDNIIQFDIYSQSYPLAEEFALWFEAYFVPMYTGSLQAYGIKGPFFLRREEDETDTKLGKLVYKRSLVYLVQTQTIIVKTAKTLDSIIHAYEL